MDIKAAVQLIEASTTIEKIKQNALPYAFDALDPCMSENCVRVHYSILTKKYFDKYRATGDLFQKAGAVLHNDFYWPLLQPYQKNNSCPGKLDDVISNSHGSVKKFKDSVKEKALSVQGNGWVLIMQDLQIQTIQNHVIKPGIAVAIDIWEHATVDHNYNREKFFDHFWNIINWSQMEQQLKS